MAETPIFETKPMTSFTYFEPLIDGHSTFWAEAILDAATNDPRLSTIHLVTNAQLAARLRDTCKRHGISPEILPADALAPLTKGNLWTRGQAQWRTALEIRAKMQGDVFLPFFDHAVAAAALDRRDHSGKGQISGVIFRAPNTFGQKLGLNRNLDHLRRWVSYRLASRNTVKSLFTLDESIIQPKWVGKKQLLHYLPDPVPDLQNLHRMTPDLRQDQRANYLLFGSLDARKGIFQMLEAWAMMEPGFHQANALRLVGKLSSKDGLPFRHKLEALRHSTPAMVVEVIDRFVTEAELAQEVCNAKVILAPYQNHIGSSGVLYWAAAAGKPILGQNSGLMGFLIEKYNLGLAVDTQNPAVIAKSLGQEPLAKIDPRFYQSHTLSAFSKVILDGTISQ